MGYFQFFPLRALRAARVVFADPDDLPQVFVIVEALSCDTLERVARRLDRSESGRRLRAARPDIAAVLSDRRALARMPEGSLGRAYLAFVEREMISADGIRDAGARGANVEFPIPQPLDWVHARLRDTHDLWHAVTGYSGDVLGETALLAFTFAQTWNPAIALIIGLGWVKSAALPNGGANARRTIVGGFLRGRKAAWLPEQEWEGMLPLPLHEVRRRLGLESPPSYIEIRSSEMKQSAPPRRAA
jgi:ubiquinone biosynthesis protein COQ4